MPAGAAHHAAKEKEKQRRKSRALAAAAAASALSKGDSGAAQAAAPPGLVIVQKPVPQKRGGERWHNQKRTFSSAFWSYKEAAKETYLDFRVQVLVAALIAGNFLMNIVEKQVWPTGQVCDLRSHECLKDRKCRCRRTTLRYRRVFATTDLLFNVLFSMELSWNMYATWWKEFWSSGWNVFDFITVLVSWLMKVFPNLPGPLKMLRMVRALRVFRLFKRVKSLRKILESLARAVPGVINAFIIMLIVMCIYAILAVDFFHNKGRDGVLSFESGFTKLDLDTDFLSSVAANMTDVRYWVDNLDGTGFSGELPDDLLPQYVDHLRDAVDGRGTYYTPRHSEYGHEYWGNFGKSLFTLFQVLTGDSWAEAIVRPLLQSWSPFGTAIFFISFILLHSIVLINVVVAVLLEKMVTPDDDDDDDLDDLDGGGGGGFGDDDLFHAYGGGQDPFGFHHAGFQQPSALLAGEKKNGPPLEDNSGKSLLSQASLGPTDEPLLATKTGPPRLAVGYSGTNLAKVHDASTLSQSSRCVSTRSVSRSDTQKKRSGAKDDARSKDAAVKLGAWSRDVTMHMLAMRRELHGTRAEIDRLQAVVSDLVDSQSRLLKLLEQKHGSLIQPAQPGHDAPLLQNADASDAG